MKIEIDVPSKMLADFVCINGKSRRVVRIERFDRPQLGDWYWNQTVGKWTQSNGPASSYEMKLIATVEQVPEYFEPTPIEALRMLADAGGKLEIEGGELKAVDVHATCGGQFYVCMHNPRHYMWAKTIRVRKPEST